MDEKRTRIGHRLLSLALILCMVISMAPAYVLAVDTDTTSTNVSTVLTYAQSKLQGNFSIARVLAPASGNSFSWDTEGKTDTWRYFNGVMVDALLMAGIDSNAGNALEFASDFYDTNITGDASSVSIPKYGAGQLDSVEPARALFDLLDTVVDQDKYDAAIQYVYSQLESQTAYPDCGGNYLHKTTWTDWQIGLDGLYMAQPFLMECAKAIDAGKLSLKDEEGAAVTANSIYQAVYNRLIWVADSMAFEVTKDDQTVYLYNHGWNVGDEDTPAYGNGVVWARGVGWYAAALVDVIELMPASTYKDDLISKLSTLFDGMIAYQDETSGMWYNVVYPVYTDETNKLETSGTALMAYAMMKAYNNGWVGETYGTAGLKAFNGLVSNKVVNGEITDIYKSSGVCTTATAYCDSTYYVADEAKGVGPVIMAASLANDTAALLTSSSVSDEINTIGVAKSSVDLTVAVGGTVDLTSITATVVGNKGTVTNIANGNLTLTPASVDTSTAGTKEVAVTYGTVDCGTVTVTVYDEDSGESGGSGSTYVHNFTESGNTSTFYTITGSLSTSKGTETYNDLTLTKCLKMESSTSITFNATNAGTLTLVFGGDTDAAGKTVKIDGTKYTADANGVVTVNLAAGSHEITKGDAINLFYMEFAESGSTSKETTYSLSEITFSPAAPKVGETITASTTITASDGSSHDYTLKWTVDGEASSETGTSVTFNSDAAKEVPVIAELTAVDGNPLATPVSQNAVVTVTSETAPSYSAVFNGITVLEGSSVDLDSLVTVKLGSAAVSEGYALSYTIDSESVTGSAWTAPEVDSSTDHTVNVSVKVDDTEVATAEGTITVQPVTIVIDGPSGVASGSTANYSAALSDGAEDYTVTWSLQNAVESVRIDPNTGVLTADVTADTTATIMADVTKNATTYATETKQVQIISVPEGAPTGSLPWYKYVLDTNGVDAGATYLIVNREEPWYALMNNSGTDAAQEVTISREETTSEDDETSSIQIAAISENVGASLWTFNSSSTSGYYNAINVGDSNYYLSMGGGNVVGKTAVDLQVVLSSDGEQFPGRYQIRANITAENQYLKCVNGEWQRGTVDDNNAYAYLYKQESDSSNNKTVTFYVAPTLITADVGGSAQTLIPMVTVSTGDAIETITSYSITWTSSDTNVATVDSNGAVSFVGAGSATITATLTAANGTNLASAIQLEVPVTVKAKTVQSEDINGNNEIKVYVGDEPDFSGITLTITYDDGTSEIITTANGLVISGYDVNQAGTYTAKISYKGTEYEETVPITVVEKEIASAVLSGNENTIEVPAGGTPNYFGIQYTISYKEVGGLEAPPDEVVTALNGLTFEGFDSSRIGLQTVTISYNGEAIGSVTVNVSYNGLETATDLPEYPDDGAVRINKTATGQDFYSTGVVQIELDTAGITVKQGMDVILVVDVSNSMGWSDNWFENMSEEEADAATDMDKLPVTLTDEKLGIYDTDTTVDKLDQAMAAAQEFATALLADNKAGAEQTTNNSITFVTFAGYDADNFTGDDPGYIDSVQTVFTNVQDAETANKAFSNTKFTQYQVVEDGKGGYTVKYTLQIGNTDGEAGSSGPNRGNTNYDYAFGEALSAVNAVQKLYTDEGKETTYADSGRETIVVFMTDGAPSHYSVAPPPGEDTDPTIGDDPEPELHRANGTANDNQYDLDFDNIDEDTALYPPVSEENFTAESWLEFINENPNFYATKLYIETNGFYAVGFDLDHGGFSSFNWSQEELKPVLAGLAGGGMNEIPVTLASDGAALSSFYQSLASALKYAGTVAQVTDTIDADFTLQTTLTTGTGENTSTLNSAPTITVTAYDLYTKADVGTTVGETVITESMIGARKGTSNVLETVTFSSDGTEAYSMVGDVKSGNIMTTEDGTVTITAKYFTYTKDADGVETFVWTIGNITDKEVALSYYAYLKGSMEGHREQNVYSTNESAILEYVNINGEYATQTYPIPTVAWGSAITHIEYYLVNEAGQPINNNGYVIPFANRVVVGTEFQFINWNDSLTVNGAGYVPTGYVMYSPSANYTVSVNSNGTGSLTINDTLSIADSAEFTTKRVDTDSTFAVTTVAFGVKATDAEPTTKTSLNPDKVVVDYGKPILVDVTGNEPGSVTDGTVTTDYTYSVCGFIKFNPDADVSLVQSGPGALAFNGDYGQFTLVDDNPPTEDSTEEVQYEKVQYQPQKMLAGVEKIFVVVKVTNSSNQNDFYYMLNELDIVPATSVYYETDFANNVFIYTGIWSTTGISNTGNQDSDPSNILPADKNSQDTYGYDSSYSGDNLYSNGSSLQATGAGVTTTTVRFSFTGTGFDIISRTGPSEGTIRVTVTGPENRTVSVINKGTNELYQIPVISVENLIYGTYTVEIGVYNAVTYPEPYASLSRGNSFYFDAVRIYGAADGDPVAEAEYMLDGEASPLIQEVRDIIITADSFDPTGQNYNTGAIFVEKIENNAWTSGTYEYQVKDYKTVGPNNEVYLAANQAIAFKIGWTTAPASIDLGAKAVTGSGAKLKVTVRDAKSENVTGTPVIDGREINTATALYYNLLNSFTPEENGSVYVIIENTGSDILSLTDLKVAYNSAGIESENISLTSDAQTLAAAEFVLNPECNAKSMAFADDTVRIMRTTTMTVETTQYVKTLKITDANGNPVWYTAVYVDTADGNRIWTVTLRPVLLGDLSYLVTGYDADGNPGEQTASDAIHVQY